MPLYVPPIPHIKAVSACYVERAVAVTFSAWGLFDEVAEGVSYVDPVAGKHILDEFYLYSHHLCDLKGDGKVAVHKFGCTGCSKCLWVGC